jgi:hypothetical protein
MQLKIAKHFSFCQLGNVPSFLTDVLYTICFLMCVLADIVLFFVRNNGKHPITPLAKEKIDLSMTTKMGAV